MGGPPVRSRNDEAGAPSRRVLCGRVGLLTFRSSRGFRDTGFPRTPRYGTQAPNLSAARAFAFAASSSRFFGGALVSSERSKRVEMPATSSTAARNEASFAFDGLLKPVIFLTNWSDAARTSSSVTGGSKLKRVLIFLHMKAVLNLILTIMEAARCPRFAPRFWALTWVTLYLNPARVQDQVIETWDSFNLEDWKWSR